MSYQNIFMLASLVLAAWIGLGFLVGKRIGKVIKTADIEEGCVTNDEYIYEKESANLPPFHVRLSKNK